MNNGISRRRFLEQSILLGAAGMVSPLIYNLSEPMAAKNKTKDDISAAQWALVDEIRAGKWKNLDFPVSPAKISG